MDDPLTTFGVSVTCGVSVGISAATIFALRRVALVYGWVDTPRSDPLKIHTRSTPIVGGIGIAAGMMLSLAFTWPREAGAWPIPLVFAPALMVIIVGLCDDLIGLTPATRLAGELAAALTLLLILVAVDFMGRPIGLGQPVVAFAWAGMIALYVVGGVNAVNMQDGMDGLAGCLALISCVGIALVAGRTDDAFSLVASAALAGALCGFLLFNLPPASVFMGDSGSYFLGYVLGGLSLLLGARGGTVLSFAGGILLMGVPVIDAAAAVVRRLVKRTSPFRGDRSHGYDLLLRKGYRPATVLLLACLVQALSVAGGALMLLR